MEKNDLLLGYSPIKLFYFLFVLNFEFIIILFPLFLDVSRPFPLDVVFILIRTFCRHPQLPPYLPLSIYLYSYTKELWQLWLWPKYKR